MATKSRRTKHVPPPVPGHRWFLVRAAPVTDRRYRRAGDARQVWCVRLSSMLGRTLVQSQWRELNIPSGDELHVVVRAPAWALGVDVTLHGSTWGNPMPADVTDLGTTDPGAKGSPHAPVVSGVPVVAV